MSRLVATWNGARQPRIQQGEQRTRRHVGFDDEPVRHHKLSGVSAGRLTNVGNVVRINGDRLAAIARDNDKGHDGS